MKISEPGNGIRTNPRNRPLILARALLLLTVLVFSQSAWTQPGDPPRESATVEWELVDLGTTQDIQDVWGADDNNVWIVYSNRIHYWNGVEWTVETLPFDGASDGLAFIEGTDASNVWALSSSGAIYYWDGLAWSFVSGSDSGEVWDSDFFFPLGMWAEGDGRIWAVGNDGRRTLWDGSAWVSPSRNFNRGIIDFLFGIDGIDEDTLWISTESGEVLRWDGAQWFSRIRAPSIIVSLEVRDAFNVLGVGGKGSVVRCRNGSWTQENAGTDKILLDVWTADADNSWAVGDNGTILRWDGRSWQAQDSGNFEYLQGIWGSETNTLWVVGSFGTVLKSTQTLSGPTSILTDGFETEPGEPSKC